MGNEIIRTGMGQRGYFGPPLQLELGRSWLLCLGLCAGHAMVMAAIIAVRPDMIGALIIPVALFSLYLALGWQALRFEQSAVVGLVVRADGELSLRLKDGREVEVRVLGSSFVHPWLTVLNLSVTKDAKGAGVSRHVIIVPDAVAADAYRRLRVWLEWGWQPSSPAPSVYA